MAVHGQDAAINLNGANLSIKPESLSEELAAGKLVASQLMGAAKLVPNPRLQSYVNLVGRHIANQTERKDLPWTFGVIDSSAINAFAAPGGYILITSALVQLLETEDELAAVLAHEIAHVIRKHHYKIIRKQQMLEFGMNAVEIEGADNAKKLSGMVAQILARGLDKSAEFEADRDGMVYSARAGYDSSSMLRIMEKLAASSAKDEATQLLLSTHPSSSARQSAITTVINVDIEKAAVKSSASARFGSHLEK
jgi:predicted Zn-dependent protease